VAVLAENLEIEMNLLNEKASKDLGILCIGRNWSKFGVFVLDFQRGYFCRVDFLIEAMPRNTRRRNPRRHIFCCKLIFCVEVMYVISFVETLLNRREIFCFCLAIDMHVNIQGNGN
jgi:hypothetical protein